MTVKKQGKTLPLYQKKEGTGIHLQFLQYLQA